MTTGTWLIRIGNWIARKDTFDRIVAPAIADLQVEASRGLLQRWRHYFAITAVLILALLTDLRADVVSAFDANARHVAWKRAAIWYLGCVAVLTSLGILYNIPEGLSLSDVWSAAFTHAALEAATTAVSIAIVPATLYLSRVSSSRRSIALAALIVATLTIGFAMSVRPLRTSADRTISHMQSQELPSSTNRYWDKHYLDEQANWWQDIQSGASVIPYALVGVILSRRRGWTIASTVGQLMATWFLIVIFLIRGLRAPQTLVVERWRDIALVTIVAIIWLAADWLYEFTTHGLRSRDA